MKVSVNSNLIKAEFNFTAPINIVVAENGKGKTSLLKAINQSFKTDWNKETRNIKQEEIEVIQTTSEIKTVESYFTENNLKHQMSHFEYGDDFELHLKSLNCSSGESTFIQVIDKIFREPDLVILDEPDNSLDMINQLILNKLISKQSKKSKFIICVHSAMLLRSLSKLDGVKIFNINGKEITYDDFMKIQELLAKLKMLQLNLYKG